MSISIDNYQFSETAEDMHATASESNLATAGEEQYGMGAMDIESMRDLSAALTVARLGLFPCAGHDEANHY